ncbi:hypothetical protein CHS0354_006325 [Potamilus streckersoni]|uniref:Uncharacterized protein n=1 Tax=Potamilus streckersoni TaxID=2493646 RepID=A0AAE0VQA4_9BIVA|nr:hypothetical protein CHS0354_006325 [Potamilus streckersoni]
MSFLVSVNPRWHVQQAQKGTENVPSARSSDKSLGIAISPSSPKRRDGNRAVEDKNNEQHVVYEQGEETGEENVEEKPDYFSYHHNRNHRGTNPLNGYPEFEWLKPRMSGQEVPNGPYEFRKQHIDQPWFT